MVTLVMNMKEKEEEGATVEEEGKKNGVNLWWPNGYPSKLRRFNGYTS